jgi:hypothetical protein
MNHNWHSQDFIDKCKQQEEYLAHLQHEHEPLVHQDECDNLLDKEED